LADRFAATVVGERETILEGVAGIEEAEPGDITFVSNPAYYNKLSSTRASAAIVPPDVKEAPLPLLVTENPYLVFAKVLEYFNPERRPAPGIHGSAWVAETAVIGEGCTIFPLVYVGERARIGCRTVIYPGACIGDDVTIGEMCLIYPNVTILEGCVLGNRVIVHSGTVIGADGFGFAREGTRHYKIPQVGIVRIEDDVEVGANCCIDRATMGETVVGRGTKIDNLVQVAHNVRIGEDVILVAQVGISGSTEIGDRAMLGGQVGVVGHRRVGKDVKIGAKSGVHTNIADGQVVGGIPAMPYEDFLKTISVFRNLPRLRERVQRLEKEVQALKRVVGSGGTGTEEKDGT
jgi:UDP-3-O-[3-hydroxymyristoyl] glucosamine N-acyltransferase